MDMITEWDTKKFNLSRPPAVLKRQVVIQVVLSLLTIASCRDAPGEIRTRYNEGSPLRDQALVDRPPVAYQTLRPEVFTNGTAGPVTVVVIPDSIPELSAVMVPVLTRLAVSNNVPELVVVPAEQSHYGPVIEFLAAMDPMQALFVHTGPVPEASDAYRHQNAHVHHLPEDLAEASIEVARCYWESPETVVLAEISDPESIVLAASFAAHKGAPLLLRNEAIDPHITAFLREESVKNVYQVPPRNGDSVSKLSRPRGGLSITPLGLAAVGTAMVETIGRPRIRSLVLSRIPDNETGDSTPWLAPYVSLVRRAPIVLVPTADPERAEAASHGFIRSHDVRPRSVIILGDDYSIGLHGFTLDNNTQIEAELFCVPNGNRALSIGVGRIPFPNITDASLMLSRGFAREDILEKAEANMALMVANPSSEFGSLPLCETVSRATALELRNLGVKVAEFYGIPANSTEIRKTAQLVHLILYEGHLGDQLLFDDPHFFMETEFIADWSMPEEESTYVPTYAHDMTYVAQPAINTFSSSLPEPSWTAAGGQPSMQQWPFDYDMPDAAMDDPGAYSADQFFLLPETPASALRLGGMPIVVLQSCRSLDPFALIRLSNIGCAGLIGSGSNIHSASGSTFIKAFVDNALYRKSTVGEALRDARNYFLCLQDLKDKRGHREQWKSLRVALSFRLWGDPELKLLPRKLRSPRRRPAAVSWNKQRELQVTLPSKRLGKVMTESYVLHGFPGSEAAGLVKRLKHVYARNIKTIHCFRVKQPRDFDVNAFTGIQRSDEANRAVFRTDASGRYLYVLYFPNKELPDERYTLRFTESW